MPVALVLAAAIAVDVPAIQRQTIDAYRSCVLAKAKVFHRADLSGDEPVIVAYAASYACNRERFEMAEATLEFVRNRHPELGPGSVGKAAAMFREQVQVRLEEDVTQALK